MQRVLIARRATLFAAIVLVTAARTPHAQQPELVRSTAPAAWGENLRLVEEIRIGKLDGADEYLFGSIDGVAVGKAGMIYVADGQVPIIRSYDAQGRFVRNIGRKGGGPGEYENIGGIRTFPDGRLALWDNRNSRLSVFSDTGAYLNGYRVQSGLFAADIFQVDRSGNSYIRTTTSRGHDSRWSFGWVRVAPTGEVRDTIPIPDDSARAQSFVLATASGYDRPFVRELVTTMSSLGYLITGRNDAYAFDLHRPGGRVLRIERPGQPVIPLGRGERAEWEAWATSFERREANPTSSNPNVILPAPRRVDYTIPETKPFFSELRTDSQGRIWVRRYVAAVSRPGPARPRGDDRPRREWREPPTFDVFQPDGRFLGTVTLPFNSYMYDAIDRQLWVEVRGDSDESYIVRYRIESSGGR